MPDLMISAYFCKKDQKRGVMTKMKITLNRNKADLSVVTLHRVDKNGAKGETI
jgi:hypothetical protein